MATLRAPFPYFGGKRHIAHEVWRRFGRPKQYIEPFCGSAAVLLAAPEPACLEVIGDCNGFIANFWRAVSHQPNEVAKFADYPVIHIDLTARHGWLLKQRKQLLQQLQDANWPGDAKVAGWWLWGQCAWIGSGWCEWDKASDKTGDKIPSIGHAGSGVQSPNDVQYVRNKRKAVRDQIPHISDAGRGVQSTSDLRVYEWLNKLSVRLKNVRVIHGDWSRGMNTHYGLNNTDHNIGVFFDPPYKAYESVYATEPVAAQVEAWCRDNSKLKIALCGHIGDYDLPGWDTLQWVRNRAGYSGSLKTRDQECIWFSPGCLKVTQVKQLGLFEVAS